MLELIGWIGAILFAICSIPQAYQCWKTKSAQGLSLSFLLMWFIGEVLTIIYVLPKWDLPLLFNYAVNILSLLVIFYYKVKDRLKIT